MRAALWCATATLAWGVCAGAALAEPWRFDAAVPVTAAQGPALFHHLQASGRRSIATAGSEVAVAWTDNRDGASRAYVAYRLGDAQAFTGEQRVSGAGDAYEPALAALEGGGFVVVWEEDDAVWARVLRADEAGAMGPALRLSEQAAAYPTVAAREGRLVAAWAEQAGNHKRIMLGVLQQTGAGLRVQHRVAVDIAPPQAEQSHPALAVTAGGIAIAWEDRRHGHTRLFHAYAPLSRERPVFSTHALLNELPPPRSEVFGRGSGVTRVSLVAQDERVLAVWMDKREFEFGYKVYAALSTDGGRGFGANEPVQDMFGGTAAQWHPAAALGPGAVVAAWEDTRDEVSDVMLSWREGEAQWSDDLYVPPASGSGYQGAPALVADASGNLHLVWVSRETQDGPTQLRYARGQRNE